MALSPDPALPPEKVRPLRRAEYDRMVGLGMFRDERVELLHGRLVRISPQGEPHVFSVTRLQDDRRIKGPLYAAAGVAEYWIVDLVGGAIEVHREPQADGYATITRHGRESRLLVTEFEDVVVVVGDVLPPRT